METEIRFYYSKESQEDVIKYFKKFKELKYSGRFYECTDQYNHPMKEFDFYSKKIDGRFRVRKTIGDNVSKCMITWKRRLKDNVKELIHKEEEIEVSINPEEYDNLCLLLNNVLHLNIVESYASSYGTIDLDNTNLGVEKYLDKFDDLGLYNVTGTLDENNKLHFQYDLYKKLKSECKKI